MSEVSISAQNIHYEYETGSKVLQGIDLEVYQGDFLALVGQNGAGKTTLVKLFNGLLSLQNGGLWLFGAPINEYRINEIARRVGYCYQNPDHQIFSQTVREELRFGLRNLGAENEDVEKRAWEVASTLNLANDIDEYPFALGRGDRQKLALGSILVINPSVLIIDEPTTGLDHRSSVAVMGLIEELNQQGTTIVVITHDMDLVARYARRTVVMSEGRVVTDGPTERVLSQTKDLELAYLRAPQSTRITMNLPEIFPTPAHTVADAQLLLKFVQDSKE